MLVDWSDKAVEAAGTKDYRGVQANVGEVLDGWKVPDLTDPGELSYHAMRGAIT
jgi:hypothetical protein